MKRKLEKLFDVLIYEIATGKVESIAGKNMRRNKGLFYNAQKRVETITPRLNDRYGVRIVPTGKYKVGDIMKESGQ